MRTVNALTAALGLLALGGSGVAMAGAWTVGSASGAAGTNVTVPVNFAGDGATISSQVTVTVAAPLSVVSATGVGGQSCSATGNSVSVVLFSFSALPGAATNYCDIVLAIAPGTAASPPTLPVTPSAQLCAISGGGAAATCTAAPGAVTVTGGVTNTPPNIAFSNPASGGTVTYSGAGTAPAIVATPSGGAGSGAAATTTVGGCTLAGGGAAFPAGFPTPQLSFVGPTVTAQNIVLPNCTPQAAAVNATLTCPVVQNGVAAASGTFTLTCPAAAPAGVAPVLTYNPAANSSTSIPQNQAAVIAVGCPTEGANCTGSGTGPSATSTLSNLTAVYNGPMFSPTPAMVCEFVTQGGTGAGNTLSFVALQADAGNISCLCPPNTTNLPEEPFIVSVEERTPSTAGPVARSFTIVCGGPPPPVCGTIAANPSAGTVNLTNNGGASLVTTATLTGAGVGPTQTVSCITSAVSAGSTFTVTTAPNPLVLSSVNTTGTVSAACTNTANTVGTATLTCTSTSSQMGCATLNTQYTLSCPGVPVGPPISTIPVPAMSEQGRILLAALMLLLGLGVVGFRLRG